MSLLISPWVYYVWDSLVFLDLGGHFLSHFREAFDYNLLKYFLIAFLFVLFFWDPYDSNVGPLNVVPEVSDTVLISFYPVFFMLLCFSYFCYSIYQLTSMVCCFSHSAIGSL